MKASDKALLGAIAAGIVAAGVFYWLLPDAKWWFPAGIGALVAGQTHYHLRKTLSVSSPEKA